jgi:voltage-gated potassium channel
VRAVEALATSVPFFLLLFAGTYVALSAISASNFGEHLSHTDGLYFAVTVFSTVGFGDITAKSQTARLVVTGQMIADLVILGLAIKVSVDAIRRGKQSQAARAVPVPARDDGPGGLDTLTPGTASAVTSVTASARPTPSATWGPCGG